MDKTTHTVPARDWAKEIKEICNNRCVICGAAGGETYKTRLESHHIKQRAEHPELKNVLENGVSLCHVCHYTVHNGHYTTAHYQNKPTARYQTNPQQAITEMLAFVDSREIAELLFPKGTKDQIKQAAAAAGESMNQYIYEAVTRRIQQEAGNGDE